MKKLLSMILACAMVMSLFCAVPVSAAVTAGEYRLPYVFEDFETGTTPFGNDHADNTSEIVDSGVAARGNVAQITTVGAANEGPTLEIPAGNVANGDTITVSMWIKSNVALTKGEFSVIMWPGAAVTGANDWKVLTLSFDKTSTDWQHVSQTFKLDFTGSTGEIQYRMGGGSGLNFAAGETASSETLTDRVYQIDDFEIKIEKAGSIAQTTNLGQNKIYENDFTENADGVVLRDNDTNISGERVTEDTNTFYRITDNSTTSEGRFHFITSEPLTHNKGYTVTLKMKVSNAKKSDGTNHTATQGMAVRLLLGSFWTGYNGDVVKNNDTWQTVRFSFYLTKKNASTIDGKNFYFRVYPNSGTAAASTSYIDIDDVVVTAHDSVFNGDFEFLGLRRQMKDGTANWTGGTLAEVTTDQNHNKYDFWKSDNTSNKIQVHSDFAASGTVGALMKFVTYGSKFLGATYVTNKAVYSINGKIKAKNAASAGNVEIGMLYTGTDGTKTAQPFTTVAISDTAWTTVNTDSFTVNCDDIAESALYISPVAPEGTEAGTACDIQIVSDDWSLTQHPLQGAPSVDPATASVYLSPNGAVKAYYTLATEGDVIGVTDASVYKLVADGKYYGTFYDKADIVVPEAVREVVGLSLEIVPVTSAGYVGAPATVAIDPEFTIDLGDDDVTFTNGSVTADVGFTSNNPYGEQVNGVLIVCTYDDDNALIDWEFVPVICAAGESADADQGTPGVQNPSVTVTASLTPAAYAKAFLWDCGTETSPTEFNTTMVELAPSVEKLNN